MFSTSTKIYIYISGLFSRREPLEESSNHMGNFKNCNVFIRSADEQAGWYGLRKKKLEKETPRKYSNLSTKVESGYQSVPTATTPSPEFCCLMFTKAVAMCTKTHLIGCYGYAYHMVMYLQ